MAEKITVYDNLIKVVHSLYCDECHCEMTNIGGVCLTAYPPSYKYDYKCPHCNHIK